MRIERHVDLSDYNTFAVKAYANSFARIESQAQIADIKAEILAAQQLLVLGGGSNVLFINDFSGLVIKNEIKGIEIIHETQTTISLRVGAGENWHQFVCYCVDHDYAGIENLSLIPGTVGAAPIQNIGAYGAELSEVFEFLEAIDLQSCKSRTFHLHECQFAYRNSVFKNYYRGRFLITHVTLKLSKLPQFNLSYAALETKFADGREINLKAIAQAVIEIRQSKLPDPKKIPNAGSFFKNPVVSTQHYYHLRRSFKQIPHFKVDEAHFKIPAAWLIEQCGFKGKQYVHAGVHDKQALVLINHNHANGGEIYGLAKLILRQVFEKFAIHLEYEVNII